jgi:ArsR family transcriptional regulator
VNSSTTVEPTLVEVQTAARLFGALADPARLRILAVLASTQKCVCDIQSAAPMAPNLLSYHLKALREAGLIVGRRRGRFIDYCLTANAANLLGGALAAAGFSASVDPPAGCSADCEPAR